MKQLQNALEFGIPACLQGYKTHGELKPNGLWTTIWNLNCQCGGNEFHLLDFLGHADSLDSTYWTECKLCGELGVVQADVEKNEGFDRELLERINCSVCGGDSWRLRVELLYLEGLQEEAEDDFPEHLEAGLANCFRWRDVFGSCTCGHEVHFENQKFHY
jgi:hypothetical protein